MLRSYKNIRSNFIDQARESGAAVIANSMYYHGPDGEDLANDVAIFGLKKAENTIVITSGMNGAALPFGSALQCAWFDAAKETCAANKNIRLVFVHALNPWGAAHMLRNDRLNVDVNRNFVDFSRELPSSQNYSALADALEPPSLGPISVVNAWRKLITHGLVNPNVGDFKQALAGGQYKFPRGLFFGGTEPSWTRQTWESIVAQQINHPGLKNLWHVDIDTGVGARGEMTTWVNAERGSPLHQRIKSLKLDKIALTSSSLPNISGRITDYWPQLSLPKNCVVTPCVIEVGTSKTLITGLDVLYAMLIRNTLRIVYHDRHWAGDWMINRIKRQTQEIFSPTDPSWNEKAMRQGMTFMKQLLKVASV